MKYGLSLEINSKAKAAEQHLLSRPTLESLDEVSVSIQLGCGTVPYSVVVVPLRKNIHIYTVEAFGY